MIASSVLIITILLFASYACCSDDMPKSAHPRLNAKIQTRGTNDEKELTTGSRIILHSKGGTEFNHEIFKYDGNTWNSENNITFNQTDDSTYVTAIYPVHENLYTDGALEDILIARDSICGSELIELNFRHLFSSLVIHAEASIQSSLAEIRITTPILVSSISSSGEPILNTEQAHTTSLLPNETGDYTFIIPPYENCILTLSLIMKDGSTHNQPLQAYTFQSGVKYECNLVSAESAPGIYSADDLIAFCKLINGEKYSGDKTLVSFGETIDEKTTYYLRKDITLTEEDSEKLSPIGYKTDKYFKDTFDGLGHKISNLTIKASNGNAGLFARIESTAAIKNLHLENSISTLTNSSSQAGILVGTSYGIIDNCTINNCSLTNNYSSYTGGIVGQARKGSSIINCSVCNTTITNIEMELGSITGYLAEGNILNCYIYNNKVLGDNYRGGICGYSNNGQITNCYVYKLSLDSNTKKGIFIGKATKTTLSFCHSVSTSSLSLIKEASSCTTTPNYKFTTDFKDAETNTPVFELLNQWVGEQNNYNRWQADDNLPAVFAK